MLDHAAHTSPVLSVSELNLQARQMLEKHFTWVAVAGEISNLKIDGAGHRWFCLKDVGSLLNAVIFRGSIEKQQINMKDGMQVIAYGKLTVYERSGRYQLIASKLVLQGTGALQVAYDELKQRLLQQGLFATERKRALPKLPRRVAIVTSPTGAVIRDIINVSTRRYPNAQLLLIPCRVQGLDSGSSIAAAIQRISGLAATFGIDVLIVARGGGSLEDLWGFNDEQVAHAIVACSIPVVSAVGHETDFTIADFVADCRAATPSAAAELVFPQKIDLRIGIQQIQQRSSISLQRYLQQQRYRLRASSAELGDGQSTIVVQQQRLAYAHNRLSKLIQQRCTQYQHSMVRLLARIQSQHPRLRLKHTHTRLCAAEARLKEQSRTYLLQRKHLLRASNERLRALSPVSILQRGYSIVLDAKGQAVRQVGDVSTGDTLHIRLARGGLVAQVLDDKQLLPIKE